MSSVNWSRTIVDEISKHCSAHYDDGQAVWQSPWKDLPLYQAWRCAAEIDRNVETLGLTGFREFVSELPHAADEAIVYLLQRLGVPPSLYRLVMLCEAFSVPGWAAWVKYQDAWKGDRDQGTDVAGLLAIRLAYDVALGEALAIGVDWSTITDSESALV